MSVDERESHSVTGQAAGRSSGVQRSAFQISPEATHRQYVNLLFACWRRRRRVVTAAESQDRHDSCLTIDLQGREHVGCRLAVTRKPRPPSCGGGERPAPSQGVVARAASRDARIGSEPVAGIKVGSRNPSLKALEMAAGALSVPISACSRPIASLTGPGRKLRSINLGRRRVARADVDFARRAAFRLARCLDGTEKRSAAVLAHDAAGTRRAFGPDDD
jgi:hypothetical protein